MRLGYNTNGMAHHAPTDAIDVLAELGYESVALTIDHGCLDPHGRQLEDEVDELRRRLADTGMRSVIETGARFLLDARVKHEPTLMSPTPLERKRRMAFLKHAVDMAAALQSDCVSLWSGILREPVDEQVAWHRLIESLAEVLQYARQAGVVIGFEPEPGMFIDRLDKFERLTERLPAPHLLLTLDVGHLHCQGEVPIADQIRRCGSRIVNVHLEDMRAGVHEHLMFGEGEMEFPPILAALQDVGYQGGLHVELSRHSHDAVHTARRAAAFLRPLLEP